jgi:hypothetical protein
MAFVMIKNVFPNPDNIGFFGAAGIMFEAKSFAILVQEFFGKLAYHLWLLKGEVIMLYIICYTATHCITPRTGVFYSRMLYNS